MKRIPRASVSGECPGCGQRFLTPVDIVIHGSGCSEKIMQAAGLVRTKGTSTAMLRASGIEVLYAPTKLWHPYRDGKTVWATVPWAPPWAVGVAMLFEFASNKSGRRPLIDRRDVLKTLAKDSARAKELGVRMALVGYAYPFTSENKHRVVEQIRDMGIG